jgi:subtilisin family serine protease
LTNNSLNKLIKIAVIDSGIDKNKLDLQMYVNTSIGFRINSTGFIVEEKCMEIQHPHGTFIALIIKSICNNVEFISINILNEKLTTDARVLIQALEYSLKLKPDIIHLSLGTTRWLNRFPLKDIVKTAKKDKVIIVAAANNEGIKSYPSSLKGVVGVKSKEINDYNDFYFKNNYFYAPFNADNVAGVSEIAKSSVVGTSMSAAFITGHIAGIKSNTMNSEPNEIIRILKEKALTIKGGLCE